MARTRTVLVTMSPFLMGIIESLLSADVALDIVSCFENRDFSDERLKVIRPDLVLIGLRPGESDDVARSLLMLIPMAKIIALSSDVDNCYLHEMRAHRCAIADISPGILINWITTTPHSQI